MRRSIKKVAAGLLATMMIGTMLTGCGGGNKKDSGSSKKETSEINIGFSQVGADVLSARRDHIGVTPH